MYDESPSYDLSYINHSYYTVRDMDPGWQWIYLKLNQAENSTINTFVDGINISNMTVEFKDPWYIDDYSDAKGSRNRGMNALYYSKSSPFTPSTTSNYKGVFLNQSGAPDWQPPYYTVRVPSQQTINGHTGYFQNWSTSGANVQSPTALETPVVFNSANATVSANYKGTNLTGDGYTYSYNNQRRIVKSYNGSLHKVYESMARCGMKPPQMTAQPGQ